MSVVNDVKISQKKIYLKDYKPFEFNINSLNLTFNIHDHYVEIHQLAEYEYNKNNDYKECYENSETYLPKKTFPTKIFLNGVDLELVELKLNDQSWNFELTSEGLIIKDLDKLFSEKFTLSLRTRINPYTNKSLEGLYQSSNHLVTQCEAQGFRKLTFFPDRPDVMTCFSVEIEADKNKYPVLLSNGNLVDTKDLPLNRHRVKWQDPWKKPCYLFALFAGKLGKTQDHFISRSGKNIKLEIYTELGKESRCQYAMESLKRAMKWDEQIYHREYDLDLYQIVAIDDFNAGAMENKGLNVFNSKLVLADLNTATDTDFFHIESVVAHEYFHNWTGNRITLRDWFQLSLKEGLTVFRDQEFSADMTEKGVQRIRDVDSLKEKQFPEDAGPNAHPVRPESCFSVDNFFTSTIYEKGAEVIRMMQNFLGRKKFLEAMGRYFDKFDGQAITTDDFRKTILDDNGFPSDHFLNWYQIPGTPKIKISDSFDPGTKEYTLEIKQQEKEFQELKSFQIPIFIDFFTVFGEKICLNSEDIETNSDKQNLINLKNSYKKVIFKNLDQKPMVSLLRNFSAPVQVFWKRPLEDYFVLAQFDDDTFNQRESFQKIYSYLFESLYEYLKSSRNEITFDSEVEKLTQQWLNENSKNKFYLDKFSLLIETLLKNKNNSILVLSKLIQFPSDQILLQNISSFFPQLFKTADIFLKKYITLKNEAVFLEKIAELELLNSPEYTVTLAARRELKHQVISLMTLLPHFADTFEILRQKKSLNFTDEFYYFKHCLQFLKEQHRKDSIDAFYEKWKHENLVLNKWLQCIAESVHPETFSSVKDLYSQDFFNKENPNQVYSLLRTFGLNIVNFYEDPNHWDFYLESLLQIDSFNPQVAARLCASFQIIDKLPSEKKSLLQEKFKKIISSNSKLSKNTYEILIKY